MKAIAPNLTVLVGELVGARLIAHAGSLLNLAKHPASTVQILGAEKALFRALKTRAETPKYGLIYHASLVGLAPPKFRGKISRVLAAKCSLSIRVDALAEQAISIGATDRAKVEARIKQLEGKSTHEVGATRFQQTRYDNTVDLKAGQLARTSKLYDAAEDMSLGSNGTTPKKRKLDDMEESPQKKLIKETAEEDEEAEDEEEAEEEAEAEPEAEEEEEPKEKKVKTPKKTPKKEGEKKTPKKATPKKAAGTE
jgi:nucleolar protein 58